MNGQTIIAIDAMGGDHGPAVTIPALKLSLERHPELFFEIYGLPEAKAVLDRHAKLAARSRFHPCDIAVKMEDKPSQALRQGRRVSTMWRALESVKKGEALACVSAGNTGALMAMSKFCLRTLAKIDRPVIAAVWPTLRGESVVLDCGASIGANATELIDMAVMGAAMSECLFGIRRPTVGLLNVGVEEVKGVEEVRLASKLLREANLSGLDYTGFVEGDDIGKGTVDVVVTEGFAGNIALKTAEGTARQISGYLREAMNRTLMARIGYLFARSAFQAVRDKVDPNRTNGGVFLGLNGIVVKSHGGATEAGFAGAVDIAHDMVKHGLILKINAALEQFHGAAREPEQAA